MSLSPGTRIGPYEILSGIGAGGMGEVYRARDTRLSRTVAIKILPSTLAEDHAFTSRLKREAETIASFTNPHICVLHDVGEHNGALYLVMEHLAGETLASRLRRGPLPFDETLRIAIAMADALDDAHRRGIVHRDLKPSNIMLTAAGPKLLDFGIAKQAASGTAAADITADATRSLVTAEGTLLGTLHYMAPELLAGKPADARSDIFALGTVVYEMLSGRRAFDGDNQAAIIGAILHADPPLEDAATSSHPRFRRTVKKCLAKDPERRWQSARDLGDELQWQRDEERAPADGRVRVPGARLPSWPLWAIVTFVTAAAVIAIINTTSLMRRTATLPPVARLSIVPPEPLKFSHADSTSAPQFALSPDGYRIAFVAAGPGERPKIWIRMLDGVTAQPLLGTEDATGPFWSPDGSSVAFFSRGRLKRVAIAGGNPRDLAETAFDVTSGTWNADGVILFAGAAGSAITRTSADGGAPVAATELDRSRNDTSHMWPEFLPDGHHFLYHVRSGVPANTGVYVGSIDSHESRMILQSFVRAVYSPSGHLLFQQDDNLMAQPFDARTATLSGRAVAIDERVTPRSGPSDLPLEIGPNGTLAYWYGGAFAGRPLTELLWIDRSGRPLGKLGAAARWNMPRLSPDGRHVLTSRAESGVVSTHDIWSFETASGVESRVTFDGSLGRFAIWSPDGHDLAVSGLVRGVSELTRRSFTGGDEAPLIKPAPYYALFPNDWSSDGAFVLYQASVGVNGWDLFAVDVRTKQVRPIVEAPNHQVQGRLSPDGRWLAYASNESGGWQVYVQSLKDRDRKWQLTTNGGSQPVWHADGKELFYMTDNCALVAVPVGGDRVFEHGQPVTLFATQAQPMLAPFWAQYTVSADGQRFLVNSLAPDTTPTTITIVLNWSPPHSTQ